MKYSRIRIILFVVLGMLCVAQMNTLKRAPKEKIKYGSTCSPTLLFGTECGPGLKCNRSFKMCLKDTDEKCESDIECYSQNCQNRKCLSKVKAGLLAVKRATIDKVFSK